MKINSKQEMLDFGEKFAKTLTPPITIELIGDVGVGKTTLTQGIAKGLKIKEQITSPSFTISKSYPLNTGGSLIHYDFYRLPDPGLMLDDLIEKFSNKNNIVIIEWANGVKNILPKNHHKITINYNEDGSRNLILETTSDNK